MRPAPRLVISIDNKTLLTNLMYKIKFGIASQRGRVVLLSQIARQTVEAMAVAVNHNIVLALNFITLLTNIRQLFLL